MNDGRNDAQRSTKPRSLPLALLLIGMQATLLLFGVSSMTSCSPKGSVVLVDQSQIQKLPDGSYKVSRGWMANRVKMEAALRAALRKCERSE